MKRKTKMLSNPDVRNWITALVGFVIVAIIFGSDMLHFNKAGTTVDVALIISALGTIGFPITYSMGKQAGVASVATAQLPATNQVPVIDKKV
jgi:hypothetical protein